MRGIWLARMLKMVSEDAVDWLEDKLSEYGNTRFFPSEDTDILDKLISKFGNPYFWRD